MKPGSPEKRHLFDNPRNVRRLLRGLFAVCTGLILLDVVSFLFPLTWVHISRKKPVEVIPEP